ncbi:MAG: archease [Promethearchaeota archaeon]
MDKTDKSNPISGFEFLNHPADVWVHAWGNTLEVAIENCVYGLMETMIEGDNIENTITREIFIEDETKGALLIAFLSEFLYLFDTESLIFNTIKIDPIITNDSGNLELHAVCWGEIFDPEKHIPDTEVKAITYSYLEINEAKKRTDIKIVFDI